MKTVEWDHLSTDLKTFVFYLKNVKTGVKYI